MKIAYCILAHNNPEHLIRLTKAIATPNTHSFVHIDAKSDVKILESENPQLTLVKNKVPVYWGSFHIVQATLNTFQEALAHADYDYFVVLSGADYPIKSNEYIQNFFEKNFPANFMSSVKMPGNGKTMDRVEFPWLPASTKTPGMKAWLRKIINKVIRALRIKHHLPKPFNNFTFYGGSAWVAFTRETVEYILKFAETNPRFQKFFKHVLLPDESYFQTLLLNTKSNLPRENAIMYTIWQEGSPSPETISEANLPTLKQETITSSYGEITPLFARKFDANNAKLLDAIDIIRSRPQDT